MLAAKISETHPAARIVLVEAGNKMFNLAQRFSTRRRYLDYAENPWPDDHIKDQTAYGIQSRTMAVGGLALHWGGACPRFTREDFRLKSLYGIGEDWPIDFDDVEPFYQEAEERIGVAGRQGPPELDERSQPYPMPPLSLTYNLRLIKEWAEKSGIPFWEHPVAKNSAPYQGRNKCVRCDTCNICPTGAKYSPDFTLKELLDAERIQLYTRMLVRKLVLKQESDKIELAVAVDRDRPDEPVHFRAPIFVLAGGYVWSNHLLMLSANSRFPQGLANRSGLLGRYIAGHRKIYSLAEVPMRLYPGIYGVDSLLSKQFTRPGKLDRYIRHDLRLWESRAGRAPRLRDDEGRLLLGDDLLGDWRRRSETGAVRLRAYYDVIPAAESAITLDPKQRNRWGDPMPRIDFVDSTASTELREYTEEKIWGIFRRIVAAGGGKILASGVEKHEDGYGVYDHPAGGCRMGIDPATSVVDSFGRCHDHENLFVVGSPTMLSSGCCNGTLTFVALTLRSAAHIVDAA